MLNLTIKPGEYFTIGDDIRVVFLGGPKNHCKIMIDAPKNYNIVRGAVLEKTAYSDEKKILQKYYKEPELPTEVLKKFKDKQKKYTFPNTSAVNE